MSLQENFKYIKSWVESLFVSKNELASELQKCSTKEELEDVNAKLDNNIDYDYLDAYLEKYEYVKDEKLIAEAISNLNNRLNQYPDKNSIMDEEEELVIAHVLTNLNNRLESIEDADFQTQINNAGSLKGVTLNGSVPTVNNGVADISLTRTIVGVGDIVSDISINNNSIVVTKSKIASEVQTSIPADGLSPNLFYNLGTLSGNINITLATPIDAGIKNEYSFVFDTGETIPAISWPSSVTWVGNCVTEVGPVLIASKHYEVSVLNGYGVIIEF